MGGAPSPAPLVPQSEVPINSGANLRGDFSLGRKTLKRFRVGRISLTPWSVGHVSDVNDR